MFRKLIDHIETTYPNIQIFYITPYVYDKSYKVLCQNLTGKERPGSATSGFMASLIFASHFKRINLFGMGKEKYFDTGIAIKGKGHFYDLEKSLLKYFSSKNNIFIY